MLFTKRRESQLDEIVQLNFRSESQVLLQFVLPSKLDPSMPSVPVVHAKDGRVFANSRDVAAYFEKQHRNVLQTIDGLLEGMLKIQHTPEHFVKRHDINSQNGQSYANIAARYCNVLTFLRFIFF